MTTENLPQIQTNNFPSQVDLQSVGLIAGTAHASGLYAGIGGEAKIMMILLTAKELGVGPCQALNGGIWSIQGKIEISARLMNGLIRRAGHSIKIVVSSDTHCTLLGTRSDGDSFETSFHMDDAIKAGLAGGNVWKKYPADMLYNRCMSRLARRLFSDVIGQCYVEGEIKEAKEVEKLEQVECMEIPQKQKEECVEIPQLIEEEPKTIQDEFKISFDDLTELMKIYALTDDHFKENCEKYLYTEWKITEFENLTESQGKKVMSWISMNLQARSAGVI